MKLFLTTAILLASQLTYSKPLLTASPLKGRTSAATLPFPSGEGLGDRLSGEAGRRMTDYEAVQNLIVSERLYRVSHRDAELAQCYAEDAKIHTSWQQGGVSSFVGQAPKETLAAATQANVNRCNPPLIHFSKTSPGRALVEYPSTTTRTVMVNGVDAVLTSYMRLIYHVEKRGNEWKITQMTSVNEYDELSPAIPGQNLKIKAKDVEGLRPSYRWLAYTRQKVGGTVSNDELGTDRPDELNKFYEQEYQWLNAKNMITTKDIELRNSESGKMLRGTLYLPDVDGRKPLIITAHELGSDSQRPWWVNYARHWAAEGYAVLTFDFAGGGQRSRSEGKTTDMSVLTEVSDMEAMFSEVRTWDFVDQSRIVLIGGSQGGGVASIVAAHHPKEIAAQVLLYPAFHLPENLHKLYPDLNNLPESDGRNGMITIGRKYILDMYDHDYDRDMQAYDGPVLIVHGDEDKTVPIAGSERAVTIFKNARLHIINGAGHVFLTDKQQAEFLKVADEFLYSINQK